MSIIGSNILAGAAGSGVSAYEIEQSLRFNSADSAYLNRTPGSAGNRKTWTWSGWVKRCSLANSAIFSAGTADNARTLFYFDQTNGQLYFFNSASGTVTGIFTSAYYRDASAWYHLVLSVDTTQATASNRAKIYINGVEQVVSNYVGAIAQNTDLYINNTNAHGIGAQAFGTAIYSNQYLAEVNFIDGSALDHEDFGELDDNGVWRPIKYAGSYTGQSWYLKFASGDGTDSSGLSNTWTANNFTTSGTGTDVMSDTPTTNWCTLNPLDVYKIDVNGTRTLQNGNLDLSLPSGTGGARSTFKIPSSGKWYFEGGYVSGAWAGNKGFGIGLSTSDLSATVIPSLCVTYNVNGNKTSSGAYSTYGASYSTTDTVGVAIDQDAGTVTFYKNNTSQGSITHGLDTSDLFALFVDPSSTACVVTFNFGQRDFAYTPPTGFSAINTSTLPAPDIADGSQNMMPVLWTGTGSARTQGGYNFQPDLLWIMRRDASGMSVRLHDVVRGDNGTVMYRLQTNNGNSEDTDTDVTGLTSTGFTIGNDGSDHPNILNATYVGWGWREGASQGFDIVSYTGNGVNGRGISHSLGVTPAFIIVKNRDSAEAWAIWHQGLDSAIKYLTFTTAAAASASAIFGGGANEQLPDSTNFYIGSNGMVNANGDDYIAYCFAEVEGYSKFGSYTGNGNADGPFVYCGFRPAWVLIKNSNSATDWHLFDTARDPGNEVTQALYPDTSGSEDTLTNNEIDILSNGFKPRSAGGSTNGNGNTLVFAAFAENPFGGSGISPATAR